MKARGWTWTRGAGDQGLMSATRAMKRPEMMPAPIYYAHRLVERQADVRRDGRLPWLRPDAKSQVTLRYVDGKPQSIDTVVLSTQHDEDVDYKTLQEAVIELIVKPVLPREWLSQTRYLINPTGRFRWGRRAARRLRTDRPQDHRRHVRRGLPARGRRIFRQGPVQGGPLGRLRGALRGEKRGRRGSGAPVPDSGQLRNRLFPPRST